MKRSSLRSYAALARRAEHGHHLVRAGTERMVAGAAHAMAERVRDMRFTNPGSTDENTFS